MVSLQFYTRTQNLLSDLKNTRKSQRNILEFLFFYAPGNFIFFKTIIFTD